MQKLPPMQDGPKSTVCEIQKWTPTTLGEAQAAKERYVRSGPRPSGESSTDAKEPVDAYRWSLASAEEVIKLRAREPGVPLRCVECKMPVRVHRALLSRGSPAPHFEHMEGNPKCSRGDG